LLSASAFEAWAPLASTAIAGNKIASRIETMSTATSAMMVRAIAGIAETPIAANISCSEKAREPIADSTKSQPKKDMNLGRLGSRA
jgi:molybdopterin biosynthesis enzyme MoaB